MSSFRRYWPTTSERTTFEANIVLSPVVGQYLLKLLIALADTPFVYLITGAIRRSEPPAPTLQ